MRTIRISLAAIFFVGITLLLVGVGQQCWGWMAHLQFLPSLFALNIAVIAGTLLITLLLGRLYCSVICPLGVMQDLISKLNRKKKFQYRAENKLCRFSLLALLISSQIVFGQVVIALIAPYSAYGRIVNAICSSISGSASLALLLVASVTLILIGVCAFFDGRRWCNSICPVGTILSLASRFSLWRPVIDESKCISCGKCARKCKSACIDPKAHKVDMSRCVVCFDCLDNCTVGAISYKFVGWGKSSSTKINSDRHSTDVNSVCDKQPDNKRRGFIASAVLLLGSAFSAKAEKKLPSGLSELIAKQAPTRSERIVPPGADSVRNFYQHCTACQLCVQNCPNQVLYPSTDLEHLMQPQMGFAKGYCRPECNVCSQLCPTAAIRPIDVAEKLNIKIGTAHINLSLCLAAKEEAACGNCERHCPNGALRMIKVEGYKNKVPTISEEQCIGCGACEHLCPVRPISAITVDGLSTHRN